MKLSARSVLMAGVTTLTVTAVAAAPSVQPAPPPRPEPAAAVQLTAQTQPLIDRAELTAWLAAAQRRAPNSIASDALVADQQAAPSAALLAFPGLGNAIIDTYNFIEPIVAYGVAWAQYLVGWIPFGWIISDQIGIFYFDLIEPIAQTITYNIAEWIGGSNSFLEALNDGILGSANAGIGFLNAEIRWGWGFLPPLPFGPPQIPLLPWFGLLQAQTAGITEDQLAAPDVGVTNAASDLVSAIYYPVRNGIDYGVSVLQDVLAPIPLVRIAGDQVELLWDNLVAPISDSVVAGAINPILNAPLNINSYINAAYNVGATTVTSLINTGFAEASYFLGIPLAATASTQKGAEFTTSEVSSVPSLVKDSLSGSPNRIDTEANVDPTPAGPLAEVAKTVRNVRNEIHDQFTERRADEKSEAGATPDNATNGVVRAQGEVRGGLAGAATGVTDVLRIGKPNKAAEDATKAPARVAKSFGETVKKVVKDVRQAVKDTRDEAKDRTSGTEE